MNFLFFQSNPAANAVVNLEDQLEISEQSTSGTAAHSTNAHRQTKRIG